MEKNYKRTITSHDARIRALNRNSPNGMSRVDGHHRANTTLPLKTKHITPNT